ncbi:hypothetical protein [Pyrococcus yayanosii]|uniref:Uncharacterized protein n=1 Tax=Pyrococcus yayanosii (strain CH1 / JCM 16557) TaxID=529709 RepID=F8AG40_PYRYC|nr:hypothetical protein [Pyrococcus yayanosii]AEH25094.1 hypothetical protein PYCH_14240 [Pyrococcus yayanosii CH1]
MRILKNAFKIFIIVTIAYWLLARFMVIGFVGDFLDLMVAMVVGGFSALVYMVLAGILTLIRRW